MPTINPSLVPTIPPGQIFNRLTTDTSLNVRWLTAQDPVYFDSLNRPTSDVALRQLIIAKALDAINLRLAFMSEFPFLITPYITVASNRVELPSSWIWDMHVSIPAKWEFLRLAKIKRVSGTNGSGTSGGTTGTQYTGKLRLVFTAVTSTTTSETSLFECDYVIDSPLTYQIAEIRAVTSAEESNAVDPGEAETFAGHLIFRTLDETDPSVISFYNQVAPPTDTTTGSNGEYVHPAVYELDDSVEGGLDIVGDFALSAMNHGTGLLVMSAYNSIPAQDADPNVWLNAFNYPFGTAASRTSTSPISVTIPKALFSEFDIAVPAGDNPTGDTTGTFFPVWINRIERVDSPPNRLMFVFATYNVTDDAPSTQPVEFATLTLQSDWTAGRVVQISPYNNLFEKTGGDAGNWGQHLGRGHVVLSSKWESGNEEVSAFFDAFNAVIDEPPNVVFSQASTRVSSYGLSRVPKYVPTLGQAQGLIGSTSRREVPTYPSANNLFVVEDDQGLGDRVDFATCENLAPELRINPDINQFGYRGGLCHRMVVLVVNNAGTAHDYDRDIKPRLECLLGRPVQPLDGWFDGTRMKWAVPTADGEVVWVG